MTPSTSVRDLLAELVAAPRRATRSCPRRCRAAARRTAWRCRAACPAQILATPTGWMMKSSPLARRWSAWRSQANTKARSTSSRSICSAASPACSSTTANRSPSRTRWSSVSLVVGPAGAWPACARRPGGAEVALLGACASAPRPWLRRVAPPFDRAVGFFFGVVRALGRGRAVRLLAGRVLAGVRVRPLRGRPPGLVAARLAAGFLARSLVVAFPAPRGSFGISPSLERPSAGLCGSPRTYASLGGHASSTTPETVHCPDWGYHPGDSGVCARHRRRRPAHVQRHERERAAQRGDADLHQLHRRARVRDRRTCWCSDQPVEGHRQSGRWSARAPTSGWSTPRIPAQSGADSFTYKGVSPGSGAGPSDEVGPERTVNLRIGAGSPPVCSNLSQSVPQATATKLRLSCATGGDPISSFSISNAPDNGSVNTTGLNSALVSYTSNAGYAGPGLLRIPPDHQLRRRELPVRGGDVQTSRSSTRSRDRRGRTARAALDGAPGTPGKVRRAPVSVVTVDRLFIASYLDGLTGSPREAGDPSVRVHHERSGDAGGVQGRAEGLGSGRRPRGPARTPIRWNGKVDGKKAPAACTSCG